MDEGCRQLDSIFFCRHQRAACSRRFISHLPDVVAAILVMIFIADGTDDGKTCVAQGPFKRGRIAQGRYGQDRVLMGQ